MKHISALASHYEVYKELNRHVNSPKHIAFQLNWVCVFKLHYIALLFVNFTVQVFDAVIYFYMLKTVIPRFTKLTHFARPSV